MGTYEPPARSTQPFVVRHVDPEFCAVYEPGSLAHALLDALSQPHIKAFIQVGMTRTRWIVTLTAEPNGDVGIDFDTKVRRSG